MKATAVDWKSFTMKRFLFPIMELINSYGLMEIVTKEDDDSHFVTILDYYSEWFNVSDQTALLSKKMCEWVTKQMKTIFKKTGKCDSYSMILKSNYIGVSWRYNYCNSIVGVKDEALNGFLERICKDYEEFIKDLRDNLTEYHSKPSKFEANYGVPFDVVDYYFLRKEEMKLNLIRIAEVPKLTQNVVLQIKS